MQNAISDFPVNQAAPVTINNIGTLHNELLDFIFEKIKVNQLFRKTNNNNNRKEILRQLQKYTLEFLHTINIQVNSKYVELVDNKIENSNICKININNKGAIRSIYPSASDQLINRIALINSGYSLYNAEDLGSYVTKITKNSLLYLNNKEEYIILNIYGNVMVNSNIYWEKNYLVWMKEYCVQNNIDFATFSQSNGNINGVSGGNAEMPGWLSDDIIGAVIGALLGGWIGGLVGAGIASGFRALINWLF